MYVITLQDLSYKQLQDLNNRLVVFGSGVSATSVDDEGKRWRVSVTTGNNVYTQQVLNAITATLSQAVAIPYYTIYQLPSEVQKEVCQQAIDDNFHWDIRENERCRSFDAICDVLNLHWDTDNYNNFSVNENSAYYGALDIHGASRVIAYILNHWGNFKKPMYMEDKHSNFYKLLNKKGAALPQKYTDDVLPTGYCADYCFYEAYAAFLNLARKNPYAITLADFCGCLADAFYKEYQADYVQITSQEYAMEFLCQDKYYTWDGQDITSIVNKQLINK